SSTTRRCRLRAGESSSPSPARTPTTPPPLPRTPPNAGHARRPRHPEDRVCPTRRTCEASACRVVVRRALTQPYFSRCCLIGRKQHAPQPELFEVQRDRMVRAQKLGHDFFAWTRRARDGAPLDERPEPLADRRRQHAFEILQRSPLQLLVVRVEAAKRNLQRLSRQHQRQQREDVREAFTGPRPNELVERRRAVALVGDVQQPPALPYASSPGNFPENDG